MQGVVVLLGDVVELPGKVVVVVELVEDEPTRSIVV